MAVIGKIRPVLLSVPYAEDGNMERALHLPSGWRTCSMLEITLDNQITGLGEGYIGVFAPQVFVAIVDLITPHLLGREVTDINALRTAIESITGYWSFQGAARHVVSAFEIALHDAAAKCLDIPVYQMLGRPSATPMALYGSGGDSTSPKYMEKEIEALAAKGINLFKIRARNHQVDKVVWTQKAAKHYGIEVAVDMCQNLAVPGQTPDQVVDFIHAVEDASSLPVSFLEEVLGPTQLDHLPELRARIHTRIAGGEIVTTPGELTRLVRAGSYDIAQPDATVIGGIEAVRDVFRCAHATGVATVVHAWGGPVCMTANYHAAAAMDAALVEFPMPRFPLREEMMVEPLVLKNGQLTLPPTPGLGVGLTEEVERKYAFRDDALYRCGVAHTEAGGNPWK